MPATIVVDAFWGDSGKGKISAHLCRQLNAQFCVRAGTGPQAGHSIYLGSDIIRMRQLPCGWINPGTLVRIGSGVAVDPELFLKEVSEHSLRGRAALDYRCPLISEEHKKLEKSDPNLQAIGTVGAGTGYALADARLRRAQQAKDCLSLRPYATDVARELNESCIKGEQVVVEGSQGTFLSLALSPDYPFVTSDNCTATALADDVGLSWKHINDVVMLVKALPTRVGSGPLPYEIPPEKIIDQGVAEYGVVSGRLRRKASQIDWERLSYASLLNSPTRIALTFCDHYDPEVRGVRLEEEISARIWELVEKVEKATGARVAFVDTGKDFQDIVRIKST